jgi:glycosyltransferase involved in cell wall biosynthesis
LVAAFGLIARHHPQWDLVIFGEGAERVALTQQAAELGLTGQIFLPGLTRDAESELTASHLIAVPSRYEGFPNALAEAVAAGLPAVAFAGISGVEELVVPGVTGLLADEAKAEKSLSAALDQLMTDAELRREFGAAGRAHARKWEPSIIHGQWEHVLFAAIGTPS